MTYIYYNTDGLVKMRSETKIETDLKSLEVNLTSEEEEKVGQNYMITVKGKEIGFEKTKQIVKKEAIDDLKEKVKEGKVKLEDITELLINIL
jgi:hypothetical protein